jgi:hypothetical protein
LKDITAENLGLDLSDAKEMENEMTEEILTAAQLKRIAVAEAAKAAKASGKAKLEALGLTNEEVEALFN